MQVTSSGGLQNDTTEGEGRGICFYGEGEIRLEVLKDGSCGEVLLETAKSCTCHRKLGKLDLLASQSSQGRGQRGVVLDKLFVETRKDCTSFTDWGTGQSRMAKTLAGSMPMPAWETRKPTNVILGRLNSHFSIFAYNW